MQGDELNTMEEFSNFPFRRKCPMAPPAEYDSLRGREEGATRILLSSGRPVWLVSGYQNVRKVLANPNVSSNLAAPGYPLQFDAPHEVLELMKPVLLASDPPEHTELRQLIAGEFTAHRIKTLKPKIVDVVDQQLDLIASNPSKSIDLINEFALVIPSIMICEIMGIPDDDRTFFQSCAYKLVSIDVDPIERQQAHGDLSEYFDAIVGGKSPINDGLLSRLIEKNKANELLTSAQMVGLAKVLLVGGHETTANMIGLGVIALLSYPEQRSKLLTDPGLARQFVDELMRFFSIADQVTARVATSDILLGGTRIPAGEGIIALTAAGNHDPEVFADPHVFDITRESKSHLGFGHGIHQCIGQHLAKIEMEVSLLRLFERFPNLRLNVEIDDLSFKDSSGVFGVHELPISWQ